MLRCCPPMPRRWSRRRERAWPRAAVPPGGPLVRPGSVLSGWIDRTVMTESRHEYIIL
ncbi:hypothetical protein FRAAL3125 [Frankia alni ACN14a]|uniref:Uncharacterized protein n=1 Tax=Frankia alni (strain DSM 45986 / CECT 9034 / ACN14a) TaxID=326424 RepID=Q0RL36_FRAAA|nr:hypothetical protein FRAAL3125 [Frankia alni ACN14a]